MKTHAYLLAAASAVLFGHFGTTMARGQDPASPPKTARQASAPGTQATSAPAADDKPTYARDVLPIFMGKCTRCHTPQGSLPNWLDYKTAFADRHEIKRRVWDSWRGHYYKQAMPAGNGPEAAALTEQERAQIKEWVEAGSPLGVPPAEGSPESKPERMEHGKRLFAVLCAGCHQVNGQGIPEKFPPLAQSDFLNADKERAIRVLLHGRQGRITVNGRQFNNSMPSFPLSDEDIASALTFVYNSFGNCGRDVTVAEVKTMRAEKESELPPESKEVAHSQAEPSPFE